MTAQFIAEQMDEAWVVIRPEHLTNPSFRAGIDYAALSAAFRDLTGRELPPAPVQTDPVSPTPPAPPAPTPTTAVEITITDPEVVQHITKVARSAGVDAWATHHFRSYFRIK
jgi:hypothetical protein